jgi:dTMP kinase
MLYAVNRWESKGEIERLLSRSEVLVVNRYSPSNLAYGIANGLSLDWLVNLETGLPAADLVLVMDARPSVLASRRGANKDNYERDVGFQERVREAYLSLAVKFGWTVVSAGQGIETTGQLITKEVAAALRSRGRTV